MLTTNSTLTVPTMWLRFLYQNLHHVYIINFAIGTLLFRLHLQFTLTEHTEWDNGHNNCCAYLCGSSPICWIAAKLAVRLLLLLLYISRQCSVHQWILLRHLLLLLPLHRCHLTLLHVVGTDSTDTWLPAQSSDRLLAICRKLTTTRPGQYTATACHLAESVASTFHAALPTDHFLAAISNTCVLLLLLGNSAT